MAAQQLQVIQAALALNPQPVGILRAQRIILGQHRAFIEMNQLNRHRRQLPQIGLWRVQPLAQGIGIQFQQRRHIAGQIDHDHRIAVIRMPGQRCHQAGVAARRAEHAGNMDQRLHLRNVDQRRQLALVAMTIEIVKQTRLPGFDQFCHGDGGVNVGHRVVGVAVFNIISDSQMLKAKAWQSVVVLRPVDPFRAQGVTGAHHIQQIPARVVVLPAPGVGIVKVTIENITADLLIEAHIVIADDAGFRHREQIVNPAGKGGFVIAFGVRLLRGDPGYHHRLRLRQIVVGQFAVENLRLTDDIQFGIGANGGELGRPIERRVGTEGFVIVE